MTIHYNDVRDVPLESDAELLDRLQDLLGRGMRQQLWLMFLDAEHCQLPLLMPTDVPRRPDPDDVDKLSDMIALIADEAGAASVVVTFERAEGSTITDDDRAWFRLIRAAALQASVPLRGPLLCHTGGVRWVAVEDYALG